MSFNLRFNPSDFSSETLWWCTLQSPDSVDVYFLEKTDLGVVLTRGRDLGIAEEALLAVQ